MARYIHQLENWPDFHWDAELLTSVLGKVRHRQGRLFGKMEALGCSLQDEASLQTLTLDVLKSSEIEGEILASDQVRSSIARKLGMDIAGLVPSDRNVDGVVEMMLDATQHHEMKLTEDRLFRWHAALFPHGKSGLENFVVGSWRTNSDDDPMRVVSGPMGRERIHFEAPKSALLNDEMKKFMRWFNTETNLDEVLKAAIAHLWFVTIHPFDDGNGRIARAIGDMQLARGDASTRRFYSLSTQILKERKEYYEILEETQKGNLDITAWLEWFLNCLDRALSATDEILVVVMRKAKFWEKHSINNFNDRQKLMLNKLLNGLEGKLTSSKWAKMAKTSSDTAVRDINDLLQKEVLKKEASGGRSTSYIMAEE